MVYSLIVIVLVLLLDRLLPDRGGLNPFSWFDDWVASVEQRFNGGESRQGIAATALTVGSVFLATIMIQSMLTTMGWWLRFGFDIAVMYFFVRIGTRLDDAKNLSGALTADNAELVETTLGRLPAIPDEPVSDAGAAWLGSTRLLAGTNDWFFAPVFWYLVLGPAGAALYFTSGIVARSWNWRTARYQEFGRAATGLHQVLSWLPVRILAVSYALMGDFETALRSWRQQQDTWTGSNEQLLVTIGLGALGAIDSDTQADSDLLERSVALEYRVVIFWAAACVIAAFLGLLA